MSARYHAASLTALLSALSLLSGCAVAVAPAAVQNAGPPLQFLSAWGVKGDDPGKLDQPTSIATDVRGNVYIADAGSQYIDKFQPSGTPLLSFQDDRLKHPQEIAVDRGGAIYVSDPVRAAVFVFLPDGSRYRELRLQSRPNEENTLDVAVADDGSVDVLDVNGSKLFDFAPSFRLMHVWTPAKNAETWNGHPNSIVSGPADAIFVSGIATNSLVRFDEGKFTAQINLPGEPAARGDDQFALSANYIFQADPDGHMIHVWTLAGAPKADLDLSPQLGDGQRSAPPIAITPTGDLLVLDTQQARVLRYHINL
jgi:streptogramin lyase